MTFSFYYSGDVGTIITVDQSEMPYEVETADGSEWWYQQGALKIVHKRTRLSVGDKVKLAKRYADFGDASNGPLKPGPACIVDSLLALMRARVYCSCRLNCMSIVILTLHLDSGFRQKSVSQMTFSFSSSFLLIRRCRHNHNS
jgi:hypothetical protein